MKKFKCKRCDHKWIPRIDRRPLKCPACFSPKWDKLNIPKKEV